MIERIIFRVIENVWSTMTRFICVQRATSLRPSDGREEALAFAFDSYRLSDRTGAARHGAPEPAPASSTEPKTSHPGAMADSSGTKGYETHTYVYARTHANTFRRREREREEKPGVRSFIWPWRGARHGAISSVRADPRT